MADIGYAILILALIFAAYASVISIVNVRSQNPALALSARNSLIAVFVLFTLAIEIMLYALISNDFDVKLVAIHSSKDMSLMYKLTALYSDKAGSLMFWGWLVSVFAVILTFQKRKTFNLIMQHATGIFAIIITFFLVLITIGVDVFEESPAGIVNGMGQTYEHAAMLVHPLLLFLGFAGFAIVFAFSLGSLLSGHASSDWTGAIRRWALFSWCTLGIANLVGAWWAWDVGNWGGYWAWDPVENAGLMPWLLGTALIHSIAIQRKRGYLKSWTTILACSTFVFTLLSPFITHGGLEESPLHGFNDSPVPPYVLSFIVITLAGSIGIIVWRRNLLVNEAVPKSLISREGSFLFTNLILVLIVLTIFFGTIIPGLAEDVANREVDIQRDFFDRSAGPMLLVLVFFMGICPLLGWRQSSSGLWRRNALFPFVASSITALAILISGVGTWYALGALVCGFPFFTMIQEWTRGTRVRHRIKNESFLRAFIALIAKNQSRYGGFIVHIGIIFITIGVIGSSLYSDNWTVNLLWIGGGILLLGGIVAFWPERRQPKISKRSN